MAEQEQNPELFVKDKNIDRRTCHRTVPMQVLSLSISKTGTASMQAALELLGYNETYHFHRIYSNMKDADFWIDLLDRKYSGKPTDWRAEFDKLLGHCAAVTDTPAAMFYEELIEAYPEAKVLLVERDVEAWVKSIDPIVEMMYNPLILTYCLFDPQWLGKLRKIWAPWAKHFFGAHDAKSFRENLRDGYRRHNDGVRGCVPKERLLEYKLGSGWEPLCGFLGKEVPDVEFPRVNESTAFKGMLDIMRKRSARNALTNIAMLGTALIVGGLSIYLGLRRTSSN